MCTHTDTHTIVIIQFLEPIPYGEALLSLDGEGRGLVLPQPNVPGFVASPGEALPFLRIGQGRGEKKEGRKGVLWLICKIKKTLK